MKLGILKADNVRSELARQFGEYPDMFREVLVEADPDIELRTYEVMLGEYPEDIHEVDGYIITGSKASLSLIHI